MKPLAVIPTYNEREGISGLLRDVMRAAPGIHVLVVDDSSPDGTGMEVQRLARKYRGRLHLISRPQKLGLGSAYVAGFQFALARRIYDPVIQMDADRSHDPAMLPSMLARSEGYDAVIGTRYLGGVRVIDWPWRRLLLSMFANWYARMATRLPLSDLTGGYNLWHRRILAKMDVATLGCRGYAFQIELKHRCYHLGGRILELPIVFSGRMEGNSKLSRSVILEAILAVWRMRFKRYRPKARTGSAGGGEGSSI